MFPFLDIEDLLKKFYELIYHYCSTLVTVNNKKLNIFYAEPLHQLLSLKFQFSDNSKLPL